MTRNFSFRSPIFEVRPIMKINYPLLSRKTKLFHLERRFITVKSVFTVFTVFGYFREYFPELSYSIIFVLKIDTKNLAKFGNPTNID